MKHDQALKEALAVFAAKNPAEIVNYTGVNYDEQKKVFQVPYFGRQYEVSYPAGLIAEELDQSDHLLIIQYLNAQEKVLPQGKWVSFLELPGGPNHYPPFVKRGLEPLAAKFATSIEKFSQAALSLGGQEIKMGDKAFLIPAFPYLPLAVALWQEDEEFPAQANILFDATNLKYLATASLYILGINLSFKLRGEEIISG